MFQKLKQNVKLIDIFGQQITLSFRQQEAYKTSLGGLLSICIIGIVISFFYSNIIDFFAKNSVTTHTQIDFNENPEQVIFQLTDMMFAAQIEQTDFIKNPYFNITLEQRIYTRDENGTLTKLPTIYIDLVPCTLDHFAPIFNKYNESVDDVFYKSNLANFLCPNLSHPYSQNLTVGGAYQSTKFSFLRFTVSSCKNSSSSNSYLSWQPVCQSQDALNKKLASDGSFRFQLYTTNYLINPNEAHDYVKPYIAVDQFYSFVPNSMFVQSDIFFRPKTIITDEGILMIPMKNSELIPSRDYGDYRSQIALTGLNSQIFGTFYFLRSPFSYTVNRSYMKLTELLSYLGGFAQFMVAILGIFIKFYNREHMIIELANDLYQFDLNKRQERQPSHQNKMSQSHLTQHKLKKSTNEDSVNKIRLNTTINQMPVLDQNGQMCESVQVQEFQKQFTRQITKKQVSSAKIHSSQIFEQFKNYMKQKQYIGISLRLILSQILPFDCLKSDECIVIQKAMQIILLTRNQVNKEFDVQFMMKQLHEMIKLKKVLFNDDQIQLFNFSQKPKISLIVDKRRKKGGRQSIMIKQIEDIQIQEMALSDLFFSLVSSYQKLLGQEEDEMTPEQRRFNTRLISLLGNKLPNMIEKELDMASDEDLPSEQKQDDVIHIAN